MAEALMRRDIMRGVLATAAPDAPVFAMTGDDETDVLVNPELRQVARDMRARALPPLTVAGLAALRRAVAAMVAPAPLTSVNYSMRLIDRANEPRRRPGG